MLSISTTSSSYQRAMSPVAANWNTSCQHGRFIATGKEDRFGGGHD